MDAGSAYLWEVPSAAGEIFARLLVVEQAIPRFDMLQERCQSCR